MHKGSSKIANSLSRGGVIPAASASRLTRRQWLGIVPAGVVLGAAGHSLFAEDEIPSKSADATKLRDEFPAQPRELVSAVVGASHTKIDKVRELVTARPALARAAWDWGFGDWETALGAASHMGRGDIATLLMEHGARPNLFTLAMMGRLQAVRAFVEAMPGIQRTLGPHGITLMDHARAGQRKGVNSDEHRDRAREVEKYLESLGDADTGQTNLTMTDEQKKIYLGTYRFGAGANDTVEVGTNMRGLLSITIRPDGVARTLFQVRPHEFRPGGINETKIQFAVNADRAVGLTIHDPEPVLIARRD